MPSTAEYDAALKQAVVFNLPKHGMIELSGPEAVSFMHNLCTNDIKNLPANGGCEAFLCNARARTLAHLFVNRWSMPSESAPVLLLDMEPVLTEKVFQHLNKYHISEQMEIVNRTGELAMQRLCGPQAQTILERLLAAPMPDMPPLHHFSRDLPSLEGTRIHLRRQTLLGLPGFDLFCSIQFADGMTKKLMAEGAMLAGPETHEVLRIEAGWPVFGREMDDQRFVVEVGRTAQAICYTKGCYLGQEPIVMARDRGQVNRTLGGITVTGGEPVPAGRRLLHNQAEVGQVTSSTWSPRLGQVIALAYLKRDSQEPGTELTIEGEERRALVVPLPFVNAEPRPVP